MEKENIFSLQQNEKLEALIKVLKTAGYAVLNLDTELTDSSIGFNTTGAINLKIAPIHTIS